MVLTYAVRRMDSVDLPGLNVDHNKKHETGNGDRNQDACQATKGQQSGAHSISRVNQLPESQVHIIFTMHLEGFKKKKTYPRIPTKIEMLAKVTYMMPHK